MLEQIVETNIWEKYVFEKYFKKTQENFKTEKIKNKNQRRVSYNFLCNGISGELRAAINKKLYV